ncbi:hypothetical protein [Pedobacter antarcticus]|uniref:hypothetical protein n=1 Tax=Pedobacter antarcticus TaxID=34086 RepID=UPI00088814B7|nr:hypothetical protein [Pedobacter antarcticus]SDM13331.1 hypothetical protein SAMN04488084_1049 [Pedobacter antarcticus]
MEYGQQLNELKGLILSKCGIRYVTPADCKRISIEISRELNKNVSETTIKRLFGFAVVKHKFSNFTLTTLADFVDMAKVTEFIIPEAEKCAIEFKSLREKASKITQFTLKTIKNRSGIPYQYTISRDYAVKDFERFYQNETIFTSLVSQPGYGKTISLSHLAEEMFYAEKAPYKESTVLFLKAYNFFSKELARLHIDELLQVHLQLNDKQNILDYINKTHEINNSKFVLIIDGFSDMPVLKEDLFGIFDNLINLICALEDYKNIKLILSMRSTTWTRFYDRIRHSSFLMDHWFPGQHYNANEMNNVPAFSEKEVDAIVSKLNEQQTVLISPALKAQLKYPFQIQLYYQLKEENPDFSYYSNITFFELVSRFIKEKIYHSNYYTEKILFLKKIIKLTNYGKNAKSVEKDKLFSELSSFRNAYMELIADGILMEEKSADESHPKEYVRFLHPHTFEYFLFVEILEKFNLQTNSGFFNFINKEYEGSNVRFQLLQWTARFLIITNNFNGLRQLLEINLVSFELNYLLLFVAEEIKYRSKSDSALLETLEKQKFHDYVISKLNNFDFIDSCYRESILAFISITKNQDHLITYYAILGIIDFCRLDKVSIKNNIEILSNYEDSTWMFHRARSLQVILAILNGTPVKDPTLLQQITDLKNGKNPFNIEKGQIMNTKVCIGYVYLLFINLLTGDPESGADMLQEILKVHADDNRGKTVFSNYLIFLYGLFLAQSKSVKYIKQGETLIEEYLQKKDMRLSRYQEAIISMLKAQQAYSKKDYVRVLSYSADGLAMFRRNDIALNPIMIYNLLIKVYSDLKNYGKAQEYTLEKMELINKCQIDQKVFANF